MQQQINVLGTELQPCSTVPMTGFYRTGCCETGRGNGLGSMLLALGIAATLITRKQNTNQWPELNQEVAL